MQAGKLREVESLAAAASMSMRYQSLTWINFNRRWYSAALGLFIAVSFSVPGLGAEPNGPSSLHTH